ncbi:MAG: glycosyltransferase [Candidatus Aminicenantales bacterium]
MEKAKVALIHDWLTGRRGGEKVLEVLAEIFPQAPIFTLFHFAGSQVEEIEKREIITSFLQRLPWLRKRYRFYLPLFPLASELFNLEEYDFIISSSHCVAKGIIPPPHSLHISYVHSPVRYGWNQYFSYFSPEKLNLFSRLLIPPIIHYLRLWDTASSHRVDYFIANSRNVASRIEKYYRRPADIIHPPVDTQFFKPGSQAQAYYLIVSALVPYKRIDLAIEAFNRIGEKLKIVGQGPEFKKLKKMAASNIEFYGSQVDDELLQLYQQAKALILPGEEDFGITSLEAQACGIPVIAYGRGGATESIKEGLSGLLFPELRVESLLETLDKFQAIEFNRAKIRANALRFSRDKFKAKLVAYFRRKWQEHRSRND